jgi:hypothetical protein
MPFEAMLTEEDIALLQVAVDRALDIAENKGLNLTPGDIAARLAKPSLEENAIGVVWQKP